MFLVWFLFALQFPVWEADVALADSPGHFDRMWEQLLAEARHLHLPTKFLTAIPAHFIRFEFEDLHTYAAEYHPEEHRMVLDRSLSLNAAGRTLRPLSKLTHKEVGLLYHELVHAYMDYLSTRASDGGQTLGDELLAFARSQQGCRYGAVVITPIPQRPGETEARYLSEAESWEALNETWAVFVGWAVWNQLELQRQGERSLFEQPVRSDRWIIRFQQAAQRGELRGYYVPEDPEERRLAQKRFLGKGSQVSWTEARMLMKEVLGLPEQFVQKVARRGGLAGLLPSTPECERAATQ